MEFIQNQKVIAKLFEAGDKLEKPRQVDHWIYFSSEKDRECFIGYAVQNKFKIERKEKTGNKTNDLKLQISRTDKVDMKSITSITMLLRKEAAKCNGHYDGWETFVIKQ